MFLMNLARERRMNNVSEREVWISLLKHRWTAQILNGSLCLDESQENMVILLTAQELNLRFGVMPWVPEEDLIFGLELYFSIHMCSYNLIAETAKLSVFFESLLTNHSLNSVVAATMQNIQPRAGDNIKDFTAINMWYQRLDERYNFSLESNILPLMTSDNLEHLKTLDPPYLQHHKGVINEDKMSSLFGKTVKVNHTL